MLLIGPVNLPQCCQTSTSYTCHFP